MGVACGAEMLAHSRGDSLRAKAAKPCWGWCRPDAPPYTIGNNDAMNHAKASAVAIAPGIGDASRDVARVA